MASKYTGKSAKEDVQTTELNSITDGAGSVSATFSNDAATTERDLFADFALSLDTQGVARSAGASVSLYILPEVNDVFPYYDVDGDPLPSGNHYRGSFSFDAATTARVDILEGVRLPNSNFKVLIINNTGQTFAATANTLQMERYDGYEDV